MREDGVAAEERDVAGAGEVFGFVAVVTVPGHSEAGYTKISRDLRGRSTVRSAFMRSSLAISEAR